MLNNLGDVLALRGKLQEALQEYRRSLTLAKLVTEQDKTNSESQQVLALCYRNVGDQLKWQGKLRETLEYYQQSLKIWTTLSEQDKSNTAWQQDLARKLRPCW